MIEMKRRGEERGRLRGTRTFHRQYGASACPSGKDREGGRRGKRRQ
jgi:hypothetical protein